MSRLLSAGFTRLFKNKLFYASIVILFGMGIAAGYSQYTDYIKGYWADYASALFSYSFIVGCSAAVMSSMFSGSEYSDGTIRNKIISGCNRVDIYLSNLVINFISAMMAVAAYLIPYLAICLLTLEKSEIPTKALVIYGIVSIFSLAAFCAIYNAITMLTAKKATAAVACLLAFAVLMFAAMRIYVALEQPEYVRGYTMNESGNMVEAEPTPNRYYLSGTTRKIYEWTYNILPSGQITQLMSVEVKNPKVDICCSVGVVAIITLAGAVIFNKKDLK